MKTSEGGMEKRGGEGRINIIQVLKCVYKNIIMKPIKNCLKMYAHVNNE
jgi:hypothetical protein